MRKKTPLGRGMKQAAARRKMVGLSAFVLALMLISGSAFAAANLRGQAHFDGSATLSVNANQSGLSDYIGDCPNHPCGDCYEYECSEQQHCEQHYNEYEYSVKENES